jgi:hypothetical protein
LRAGLRNPHKEMNGRISTVLLALAAWATACSEPLAPQEGFWHDYSALQCETAASCDCDVRFESHDECVEALVATRLARQRYYADLHFDWDCADRWMQVSRELGCSPYQPLNSPACSLYYGDVLSQGACDVAIECTLGYRCLHGTCRRWHGGYGSNCEGDDDCDQPLACLSGGHGCSDLPIGGESCSERCAPGFACERGKCEAARTGCSDCTPDELCVDSECVVPKENGQACTESSECLGHCHPYKNVCADYEPLMCLWTVGWYQDY